MTGRDQFKLTHKSHPSRDDLQGHKSFHSAATVHKVMSFQSSGNGIHPDFGKIPKSSMISCVKPYLMQPACAQKIPNDDFTL
jgi:hypothetical protein